jgi:hypothetical protein
MFAFIDLLVSLHDHAVRQLERFLVARREDYLRYSALNYTVQQKHFNNNLTERLLEIATQYGYLFDTQDFTFVTVRDRIRCFYKSFVQSQKKRGFLMGYAARKAGLVTVDELVTAVGSSPGASSNLCSTKAKPARRGSMRPSAAVWQALRSFGPAL